MPLSCRVYFFFSRGFTSSLRQAHWFWWPFDAPKCPKNQAWYKIFTTMHDSELQPCNTCWLSALGYYSNRMAPNACNVSFHALTCAFLKCTNVNQPWCASVCFCLIEIDGHTSNVHHDAHRQVIRQAKAPQCVSMCIMMHIDSQCKVHFNAWQSTLTCVDMHLDVLPFI